MAEFLQFTSEEQRDGICLTNKIHYKSPRKSTQKLRTILSIKLSYKQCKKWKEVTPMIDYIFPLTVKSQSHLNPLF